MHFTRSARFFDVPYSLNLKVVCGRNQQKLKPSPDNGAGQQTVADWQDVVNRKDIDAVDIAVPNALHAPIALAAARAGKMIFCEKPLAMSLTQAQTMASAAKVRA